MTLQAVPLEMLIAFVMVLSCIAVLIHNSFCKRMEEDPITIPVSNRQCITGLSAILNYISQNNIEIKYEYTRKR